MVGAAGRLRSWGSGVASSSENDGDLATRTMMMIEDIIWFYHMLSSVSYAICASPHFT